MWTCVLFSTVAVPFERNKPPSTRLNHTEPSIFGTFGTKFGPRDQFSLHKHMDNASIKMNQQLQTANIPGETMLIFQGMSPPGYGLTDPRMAYQL